MKAVCFDGVLKVCDRERPRRKAGEVLVRVVLAGICNTDHEITRGYVPGFSGVPGHEFLGYVEDADNAALVGLRVTAEINFACGKCDFCAQGLGRHCSRRSVLGIISRDGAMAEYVTVPEENIVVIPSSIPDNRAVFIEPLAAALEILDQVAVGGGRSVLLLGDGKLALLIGLVMRTMGCDLTVVGKHARKLSFLEESGVRTMILDEFVHSSKDALYDVVIEASGNPSAFDLGLSRLKPRGTFVLKSTYAGGFSFNPSAIVVNEITLVGSRCGRFEEAIRFLETQTPPLEKMISAEFPLEKALEAFAFSERRDALKVVLRVS